MTHPGGQPGTGPSGPGGTSPKLTAAELVAGINDQIRKAAASLPPLSRSALSAVGDIFRRNDRRQQASRLDKAA